MLWLKNFFGSLSLLLFSFVLQAQNNLPKFEELQSLQILHISDKTVYNQWVHSAKVKSLQINPTHWTEVKGIVLLDFLADRLIKNRESHKSFEEDFENPMKAPPSEAEIQKNEKKKMAFFKSYLANLQKIKLIDPTIFQKFLKKIDANELYSRSQMLNMIVAEVKGKKINQPFHQKNLIEFLYKQGLIKQENFENAQAQLNKNVAFEGDEILLLLNNYFDQSAENQAISFYSRYYEIAKKIPNLEASKLRYEIYRKLMENSYSNEPIFETNIRTNYQNLRFDFSIYGEDSTTLSSGTLINYFNQLLAHTQSPYRFAYLYLNGDYQNVKNVLLTQKQFEEFEKAYNQKLILSSFNFEYVDFRNYYTPAEIQKNLDLSRQNGLLKQFSANDYKKYLAEALKIETLDFSQILGTFPGVFLDFQKPKPFRNYLENIKAIGEGKFQLTDIIDTSEMDSTGQSINYEHKSEVGFKLNQKKYHLKFDPESEVYFDQGSFLDVLQEAMDEQNIEGNLYNVGEGWGVIFLLPAQARFLRENKLVNIELW